MYSSSCISLRLRSCSAGTPVGVSGFWVHPSAKPVCASCRGAVPCVALAPACALGSPPAGCEPSARKPNGPVPQPTGQRKFFRCNAYKKEGGLALSPLLLPALAGLRLLAAGRELPARQLNGAPLQRTGRRPQRKFFSCNAYRKRGERDCDRSTDQSRLHQSARRKLQRDEFQKLR
jgi:hypothetical protein